MKIESFNYMKDSGWSVKNFPALDSDQTVLFIFGSGEFFASAEHLAELNTAYPLSHKIGCSTAGEVIKDRVFDHSISVAVAKFEKTKVKSASVSLNSSGSSYDAGARIAKELNAPGICGVFIVSDGLLVNGSELTRGIQSILSDKIPVTGGLAGDGTNFKKTWVLGKDGTVGSYVHAVAFYGIDLKFGHSSQGGWDIFGPERNVTRSVGNKLFELDGKPALQLYKEYLGERASELPSSALFFPLAIRTGGAEAHQIVRTVLSVDEAEQSMTFAGDIPQGCKAQLMRANFDRLIDGAYKAASALSEFRDAMGPVLSIAISCVGRKLVLGPRIEEEVDATLNRLPQGAHQIGFYSYGEISPYQQGEGCELHNQTMTLTALTEK